MSVNEGEIHSKLLVDEFCKLCENFFIPYKEESIVTNHNKARSNKTLLNFLAQVQRLIKEKKCDQETFRKEILKIKTVNILHIEVLWYLEVCNLLSLKEIFLFHENNNHEEVIKHLSKSVFESVLQYQENPTILGQQMLINYFIAMFENLQSNLEFNNNKTSICQSFFNLICSNLKNLYSENSCMVLEEILHPKCLIDLIDKSTLNDSIVKNIFTKILYSVLDGSHQTMKYIFQTQENLKNVSKKTEVYAFFILISKYFRCEELIAILKIIFLETPNSVNWCNMFPFITFLGSIYQNGWSMLKVLSNSFLKESFKKKDIKLLSAVFLIARQGCFEKLNNFFPTYLQWFGTTFSAESTRPINSEENCSFFLDFLSNLISYDEPYYLKVHLNRNPSVPMSCQSYLYDYNTLVKAQLCDLNISLDLGICENVTNKSAAAFDVENVIEHFRKTSKILNTVFQASMFSKNYYEKKFLVELLSKFEGKQSARHKVISKLHSLGKIPEPLFKKYKNLQKN